MNGDFDPQQPADPLGPQEAQALKTIGWLSYILHLVVAVAVLIPSAQPSLVLLAVALVIDLVKRGDAAGNWQASHFSWRIRTVLWAGFWYLATLPLFLLFLLPGMFAWLVISVWFLYRIVRGMVAMSDNRAVN